MKILTHILFYFLLLTQICSAQWYQQNSGTTKNLNAVQFIDANTGWAVGDSGTILKTTDSGNSWNAQTSGTMTPLNDICFTNDNYGWIVGSEAKLLRTTDGGNNWIQQITDTSLSFNSIFFLNENLGWIAGASYADSGFYIFPTILKTTDGGNNWHLKSINSQYGLMLNDVFFIDANIGFAAGGIGTIGGSDGSIFNTTNGGDTWIEQSPFSANYKSIAFFDEQNGIAVGRSGFVPSSVIVRTTDGGINWANTFQQGWPSEFNSVAIANSNYAWAVGWSLSLGSTICFSTDKGVNWASQIDSALYPNSLISVFFINSTTGWVVGANGTILHTTNGGLPVEVTSFSATSNGKEVILNWSTATELNNLGFEVQRSSQGKEFLTVGFVKGCGTSSEQHNYTFSDRDLNNRKYCYRLKQVDYDRSYEYSDVIEVNYIGFNLFLLEQNYPNPFNPTTTIGFGIKNNLKVKITVLNAIGEEVAMILNEEKEAGYHQVEFNAASLPSGIYFYQLRAGEYAAVKKMILLK